MVQVMSGHSPGLEKLLRKPQPQDRDMVRWVEGQVASTFDFFWLDPASSCWAIWRRFLDAFRPRRRQWGQLKNPAISAALIPAPQTWLPWILFHLWPWKILSVANKVESAGSLTEFYIPAKAGWRQYESMTSCYEGLFPASDKKWFCSEWFQLQHRQGSIKQKEAQNNNETSFWNIKCTSKQIGAYSKN